MNKPQLSKQWIQENSQKIRKAYEIAAINKYDITSEEAILALLKVVDPENANPEQAKLFSQALQLFDKQVDRRPYYATFSIALAY